MESLTAAGGADAVLDGVGVARGELGVDVPPEGPVPVVGRGAGRVDDGVGVLVVREEGGAGVSEAPTSVEGGNVVDRVGATASTLVKTSRPALSMTIQAAVEVPATMTSQRVMAASTVRVRRVIGSPSRAPWMYATRREAFVGFGPGCLP